MALANATTTSTLEEIINSEWVRPVFQDYQSEFVNASRFCMQQSLIGKGTSTWAQPRIVSDMGTVGDGGTSVATAYNATEITELSSVQMDLAESTITTSEYGIMRTISDTALEDVIDGFDMIRIIVQDAARILATALEDDVVGLFGSFSNTSGTTKTNLTIANVTDAIAAIRNRGNRAPGGMVSVISDTQMGDFEDALEATSTSMAVYAGAADRSLRAEFAPDNGMNDGLVLTFKGVRFFQSGLVDTANTGEDDAGAVWIDGSVSSNEPFAALGMATSREFRAATERDESLRGTEVVCTQRKGAGILQNSAGQGIVTDA